MSTDNTEIKTFQRRDGSTAKIKRKPKAAPETPPAPAAEQPASASSAPKQEPAKDLGAGAVVGIVIGCLAAGGTIVAAFALRKRSSSPVAPGERHLRAVA